MKKKTTSKEVAQALDDPFYKLEQNMNNKFDELKDIFRDYRDQILTKMDGVMKELEIHRMEHEGIKNDIKELKKNFSN